MKVYIACLYTTCLRRKYFGLFGSKELKVSLVGISMMAENGRQSTWFNLDCNTSSKTDCTPELIGALPAYGDEKWVSRGMLIELVYHFLMLATDDSDLTIVTDGDPRVAHIIDELLAAGPVKKKLRFHSASQMLVNAAMWLPDTTFMGAMSNFDLQYPLAIGWTYSETERVEMFSSHDLFHVSLQSKSDVVLYCRFIRDLEKAVGDIMHIEVSLLSLYEPEAKEPDEYTQPEEE